MLSFLVSQSKKVKLVLRHTPKHPKHRRLRWKAETQESLEASVRQLTVHLVCYSQGGLHTRARTCNERISWKKGRRTPQTLQNLRGWTELIAAANAAGLLPGSKHVSLHDCDRASPSEPKPKPQRRPLKSWNRERPCLRALLGVLGTERSTPQLSGWGSRPPSRGPLPHGTRAGHYFPLQCGTQGGIFLEPCKSGSLQTSILYTHLFLHIIIFITFYLFMNIIDAQFEKVREYIEI